MLSLAIAMTVSFNSTDHCVCLVLPSEVCSIDTLTDSLSSFPYATKASSLGLSMRWVMGPDR